ncbi:hypothetical protein DL766_006917 [Monosporascus sp. MC13-8B]|uniref:Apple domain-containing protein n=1 Tax=Monosporascus cannonballus TaxID=155416 RepID=A0ABY0HFL2_9PEZI|nr:hypothetical protein DL762_002750 [Monosporascus cannonballus]RYO99651.1 hypothetical protein DL763_001365 [Monosporascus cannonballus]RYP25824.1 hypothetical protein DL766_006917 [Monosporascus sp. MC13-8B]
MASSDYHLGNAFATNSATTTVLGRPRQQGHQGQQSLDRTSPSPYPPSAGSSPTAASPTTTNNTYASHAPLYPSHSRQHHPQHQHQESSNSYDEKLAGIPLGSGVVTVEISSGAAAPRPPHHAPGHAPSASFEFRGFDFFAKRDFNELREASRAYFNSLSNSGNNGGNNAAGGAPRSRTSFRNSLVFGGRNNSNNNDSNAAATGSLPSAWLGDETPPSTPRTEDDGTVIGGDGRAVAAAGGGPGGGSGAGGGAAARDGGGRFPIPAGGESPPPPPSPSPPEPQQSPQNEPRIFGLRRKMFWVLLVLLGIVLVVVIIAVGVGVGLGSRDSRWAGSSSSAVAGDSDSDSSGADPATTAIGTDVPPETTAAATTTTTPSASPTKAHSSSTASSPTPTATDSPQMGSARLDCPAANGTTYQVPGSIKRFLRVCGVDYRSGDGQGFATEVGRVETETMLDCMKNCAGTWGCEACGWGYLEGDGPGPLHTCFMKRDLRAGARREVDEGWSFALLL